MGWSKRGIHKERPIEGKDKRSEEEKRNGREGEGGEEGKVREKTVGERTEGEISCVKQVLSVIYICLQNEKCVP